jgi:hypothetical protein
MDGSQTGKSADHAELRRQFIRQAVDAFEHMFGPAEADQLVTLTQREQRACELGQQLSGWLLQQHVAADASVRPPEQPPPRCPKCDQPGRPVPLGDGQLPQRQLTTAAGEITLRRQQWRCAACRVAFFPPGPAAATGDGGL